MTADEIRERLGKRAALREHEAKALLREMGLSVPAHLFIQKGMALPGDIPLSYPLVAKVSSADMPSKSDAGGVRLGIKTYTELKAAIQELLSIKGADGALVEEMAPPGLETIIGGISDPQFGPAVMFGLGGVFVELYRDVAFALAPLEEEDALWLMRQVRGYRIIEGYRRERPLDRGALVRVIMAVSRLMQTGVVEEIDLNPVSLYPEGAVVLDAKVKLKGRGEPISPRP
jgi:acyl-CoA synthetase (NDP forming)